MKIYTITQHYSYVSEGLTQVFTSKKQSLNLFNKWVNDWKLQAEELKDFMSEEDISEEDYTSSNNGCKSYSFYDEDKYSLLIWEEHEVKEDD